MNKKLTAFFSLIIILAFIGYIIYDAASGSRRESETVATTDTVIDDSWIVAEKIITSKGVLSCVAVTPDNRIFIGGDSFISSFDADHSEIWAINTGQKITSLAIWGDTIFASTPETVILVSTGGERLDEWGPYEGNSLITSVSAANDLVAVADAGNKRIFLLDRNGVVSSMLGQSEGNFIIPSPYFEVSLSDRLVYVANTGQRRIETWTTDGKKLSEFGEPGTAPDAFCGCCNPAHFAIIPQGFVTSEKGINRIKILDRSGKFVEFVSSHNSFVPSVPLDVASVDGKTIYAANSSDSTLYIYIRK